MKLDEVVPGGTTPEFSEATANYAKAIDKLGYKLTVIGFALPDSQQVGAVWAPGLNSDASTDETAAEIVDMTADAIINSAEFIKGSGKKK